MQHRCRSKWGSNRHSTVNSSRVGSLYRLGGYWKSEEQKMSELQTLQTQVVASRSLHGVLGQIENMVKSKQQQSENTSAVSHWI